MIDIKLIEKNLPVIYGEISSAIIGFAHPLNESGNNLVPVYDSNIALQAISIAMGYQIDSRDPNSMFDSIQYMDSNFLSCDFQSVRPVFTVMLYNDGSDLNPQLSTGSLDKYSQGCLLGFCPPDEYKLLVNKSDLEGYKEKYFESNRCNIDDFDVTHSDVLAYISLGEYDKDNKD